MCYSLIASLGFHCVGSLLIVVFLVGKHNRLVMDGIVFIINHPHYCHDISTIVYCYCKYVYYAWCAHICKQHAATSTHNTMCMHMHIHSYTRTHAHTHAHTHTHICTHTRTHTHTYAHTCIYFTDFI